MIIRRWDPSFIVWSNAECTFIEAIIPDFSSPVLPYQCWLTHSLYLRKIYISYNEYLGNAHDSEAQGRWARQLTWELARHAVGEEIIIFPLMEKHLGDQGKKLADEDRKDHQVRFQFLCCVRLNWHSSVSISKNDCTGLMNLPLEPLNTPPFLKT